MSSCLLLCLSVGPRDRRWLRQFEIKQPHLSKETSCASSRRGEGHPQIKEKVKAEKHPQIQALLDKDSVNSNQTPSLSFSFGPELS